MSSNEQSVTLLRRNKRAQVAALKALGFNVDENARAADFPMYVKWAAGLLDVTVAANRRRDNKKFFFTVEEWQSLSATEQALFLLRGIRVRACGTSFVIAADTILNKAWGVTTSSMAELHSYMSTNRDLFTYFDAYTETLAILRAHENEASNAAATEAALAYRAFSYDNDGVVDTSLWCLPTPAHLAIIARYINEIDDAFTRVWSSDFKIQRIQHWSCGRWDTSYVYFINFSSGAISYQNPAALAAVRPISPA